MTREMLQYQKELAMFKSKFYTRRPKLLSLIIPLLREIVVIWMRTRFFFKKKRVNKNSKSINAEEVILVFMQIETILISMGKCC